MEILFIGQVLSNISENMMLKKRIHCDDSYQGQNDPDFSLVLFLSVVTFLLWCLNKLVKSQRINLFNKLFRAYF